MSGKVPRAELVSIMDKLSTELPSKKFSREVASYLLSEKRTNEIDSLARELINYRAQKGLVEVTAVSAHPLSTAAVSEIKQKVKQLYPNARKITINQRLDEHQIGGVRLEFPDKQLDLSVRNKLNKFKQLTVGN
jgi:F-type H+-transporting ATPase subunit O